MANRIGKGIKQVLTAPLTGHKPKQAARPPPPPRGWLAKSNAARAPSRGDGFADPPPPVGADSTTSAGAQEAAAPDAAQRHALATSIVKVGGSGTAEDAAAVVGELEKLPVGALQQLQRQHTSVIACRGSVTDYATDLKGKQPRGWPPGATWDNVPGVYLPDRNAVVVGTMARSGADPTRIVPPTGAGHGSANLVLHETGHSLDFHGGRDPVISPKDQAFNTAYQADKAGLDPYFQQPPPAGPEETFAETLALKYSGAPDFATKHPALAQYWSSDGPFASAGSKP